MDRALRQVSWNKDVPLPTAEEATFAKDFPVEEQTPVESSQMWVMLQHVRSYLHCSRPVTTSTAQSQLVQHTDML